LLGYIIEQVTKKSYEEAVRKYIFTPLHMTHSGFDFAHLKSNEKATGYVALSDKEATAALSLILLFLCRWRYLFYTGTCIYGIKHCRKK